MRGPDPTRHPVVASPLARRHFGTAARRLFAGCLLFAAAIVTANAIDPGAVEPPDWKEVLGLVAAHVVGLVAGRAVAEATTATLVARYERRHGRRYHELPQGDDEPAIVWTSALPFVDA